MWTEVVVVYFKFLSGKLSKGLRKTVCIYAYMFFMLDTDIRYLRKVC